MKNKLLISTSSYQKMIDILVGFYCGSPIELTAVSSNSWKIVNCFGPVEGVQVNLIKGKYRFEMIENLNLKPN